MKMIPLVDPDFSGNELEYLKDCVESKWISANGKYVSRFEKHFSEFHENINATTVSNGTVALHLALLALGVGPGHEVIVPSFTYIATVNAILYVGAKPVLVDIDIESLNISNKSIKNVISHKTKALIVPHLYGQPADMDEIMKITNKHGILLIEDCAEALGSEYKGKKMGTFGDISIYSFFGNKMITTGEGGMILCKNDQLMKKIKMLKNQGTSNKIRYFHEILGYNYRMTNLQAAIGCAQMERIESFINKHILNASVYRKYLANDENFILPKIYEERKNSYWLFTLIIKNIDRYARDLIIKKLNIQNIESRPTFIPIYKMPYVESQDRNHKSTEFISANGISLPMGLSLNDKKIRYITEILKDTIKGTR